MPYLKKPQKSKKIQFKREDRQKIYQSTIWQNLRRAKLMQSPLCEMCLKEGRITPAIDVHHIDSFMNYTGNERLQKAFDESNLMSVCKQCHQKIHNLISLFSVKNPI